MQGLSTIKHQYRYGIYATISIALITFIAYLPALQNGFINYDDNVYVYENTNIQSLDLKFLKWSLTSRVMHLWHPLSFISFAFDYAAWGLNPKGYHLTDILLHSLNTFLVYILSVRLMLNDNPKSHKMAIIAGFVTAFLFGIHPLHVESVAWVSERKDVLCAFFFLLSLLSYLKYLSSKLSRYNYVLSLIFYILALMSKPMAISLPMVLLILDYYPLMRLKISGDSKKVFIDKLPFFVFGALAVLITLWPQISGISANAAPHPITERILVLISGYVFYLQKMLFPIHLAPLYPYPLKVSLMDYDYLGSMAIFLMISVFCIYSLKRGKLYFCIWLYYIISLLPVAGVIGTGTPHSMADRYSYLPSLGPLMLIGLSAAKLYDSQPAKRRQYIAIIFLVIIAGAMGYKTVRQIKIWDNSITLWSYENKILPNRSYISYNNLGLAYNEKGDFVRALDTLTGAIHLAPFNATPRNDRGMAYYNLKNFQDAIADFNEALRLDPKASKAYNNRGMAYMEVGDYKNAIIDFNKTIELDPVCGNAYYNRGLLHAAMGDHLSAVKDYSTAIKLDSKDAKSYNNRGRAYFKLGDIGKAIADLGLAVEIDPGYARAYSNLGIIYSSMGDAEKGRYYAKKAADLGYGGNTGKK